MGIREGDSSGLSEASAPSVAISAALVRPSKFKEGVKPLELDAGINGFAIDQSK